VNIPNIGGLMSIGKAFVAANRPEILFGTSIVSTLGAVVMAARGGYKSGYEIAEQDVRRQVTGDDKLDRKEIAKLTWINYLPAAGATLGAVGSTTGLHLVHVKEKKQLAAAALMAVEQVRKEGEELKKEIVGSLGVAHSEDPKELDRAAKKSGIAHVVHSDGEIEELYLVRDYRTGRDVYSNKNRIMEALIDLNAQLNHNEGVDLNTFYGYAGFGSIPDGDALGWNPGERVELKWLKNEVRDDGRPTRPFTFHPEPQEGFDSSYG
jgi:hypothetical protein